MAKKSLYSLTTYASYLQNLEQSEVNATLDRVGFYADDWISKLKYKYVGDKNA